MSDTVQSTFSLLNPEQAVQKYKDNMPDVAIIGGGPAGYTAAINAANRGRSVVIITTDYKNSYLYKAKRIDNMPGFPEVSGSKLLEAFRNHALSMDVDEISTQVQMVMPIPGSSGTTSFQIAMGSHILPARTCVLATGVSAFKTYEGEEKFLGRGVSYCGTCDGMLYRGKKVSVIAQSEDALEEALHLVKIGCQVSFFASERDRKKWFTSIPGDVFEHDIVSSRYAIEGETKVTALSADSKTYETDGVFILRTSIAPDSMIPGIQTRDKYIEVDRSQKTSIAGLFAAGDCTGKPLQIAKALGEGLVAALSCDAYLTAIDANK